MLSRVVAAAAVACLFTASANAQSSYHDFSKPMSGKSRFVFNHDGTPRELGAQTPSRAPAAQTETTPSDAQAPAWGGAAPVQNEAQAQAMSAGQQSGRDGRRSGGSVVFIGAGSGGAQQPNAAQQKSAPAKSRPSFRIGRRRR